MGRVDGDARRKDMRKNSDAVRHGDAVRHKE